MYFTIVQNRVFAVKKDSWIIYMDHILHSGMWILHLQCFPCGVHTCSLLIATTKIRQQPIIVVLNNVQDYDSHQPLHLT